MPATTPRGQVLRHDAGVRLEFVRSYDAAPAAVWAALTERTSEWFGSWTGDPATGTVQLRFVEAPDEPQAVPVLRCDPPSALAVELPSPDGTWPVQVLLHPDGAGTALTFTHDLAEPYDATSIGPGWHYYLDRLGAVVAGEPVPQEWADYEPLGPSYAVPD